MEGGPIMRESRQIEGGTGAAPVQEMQLAGRHSLSVERMADGSEGNLLRLFRKDGQVCLTIEVTEKGPVIKFEGAALTVQAAGDLVVEAERIALAARKELALASGGNLSLHAAGDLTSEARIQTIRAQLGNVNVKANDDVRLDGERVMVNCVET